MMTFNISSIMHHMRSLTVEHLHTNGDSITAIGTYVMPNNGCAWRHHVDIS
jgi:hypothetical protein